MSSCCWPASSSEALRASFSIAALRGGDSLGATPRRDARRVRAECDKDAADQNRVMFFDGPRRGLLALLGLGHLRRCNNLRMPEPTEVDEVALRASCTRSLSSLR